MVDKNLQGIVGELGVCKTFDRLARKYHIKYLHNVPIKGVSSMQQIDAVLLTPFGFYAVEIKNWLGTIVCSTKDYYWSVTYGKRQIYTKSPLLQNAQHCRYLSRCVGRPFSNLVIFSDQAELIDPISYTLHMAELEEYLASKSAIYTSAYVDKVYEDLSAMKRELEIMSIADAFYRKEEHS